VRLLKECQPEDIFLMIFSAKIPIAVRDVVVKGVIGGISG
jgi:hypothetical protein